MLDPRRELSFAEPTARPVRLRGRTASVVALAGGLLLLSAAVFAGAVGVRLITAAMTARMLNDREGLRALWLLPLRDLLALASWYLALTRRSFVWRGNRFGLTRDGRIVPRAPRDAVPRTAGGAA